MRSYEQFEICYFEKGVGEWRLGGAYGEFQPGSLFVCPPRFRHAFRLAPRLPRPAQASAIVLHFSPLCLPESLLEMEEMEMLRRLSRMLKRPLEAKVRDRERFIARLKSVGRARGALRLARLYAALELMAGLDFSQASAGKNVRERSRAADKSRFERAKRLIEQSCCSELSRSDLALEVGLDPASFSRFFKRMAGKCFADYLAGRRVQRAAEILGTRREMGLDEIARRSGFRSQASFHRQFKRRLGITPSRYRKQANRELSAP